MTISSAWLLSTGQTRSDTRVANLGALTPLSPLASRSGVLPGSINGQTRLDGFDLSSTSAMSASVLPGRAAIQGSDSQGTYQLALTSPVDLTFADGDPQNDRVDLVVLQVYDDVDHTEATVEIVEGIAGPGATAPAVPALALPLYEVTVRAGGSAGTTGINWTSDVLGRRTTTVAVGGILPVTTDATAGSYPGQYRDANGILQRWDGSAWQLYPPVPTWQSWTPTWTTSSGAGTPTLGNATVTCRYVRNGNTVHLAFGVVFQSTTKFGTGGTGDNWRFTLPVPAASTASCIGFVDLVGGGNGQHAIARMQCTSTTYFELQIASGMPGGPVPSANQGTVDSLSPWTWASGYSVQGVATYEAAS
jgi:hypothetical protein